MYVMAQDLRLAFRQLRKTPLFALAVILTLALGVGSTTAIFSLVEGILLRPLPFSNPDRLVLLGDHLGPRPTVPVTPREIGVYSGTTTAFSSMGAFIGAQYELSGGAVPEQLSAQRITAGLFPTLGKRPILGRTFTQQEEDARQQFAVISYGMWSNRFHRDPNVIGNTLVLDRKTYSIIGVMSRDFEFPVQPGRLYQSQLWVPMSLTEDELSEKNLGNWGFHIVARLRDGVTMPQAASDADRVAKIIMRGFPPSLAAIHIQGDVIPLRESVVADIRPMLNNLLFAVSVVLLIACANVAGLLLVRAIRRRREYAVRLALGARSGIILRQSIFEGLLLSLTGGVLGLALAATAIRTALHLLPDSMPRIESISINAAVTTFAVLVALASGTLCSFAPAFAALRTNLTETLKEGSRTGSSATSHAWLRSALVVSEIAVALVLLTISGAFLRSFQKMRAVNPGFSPDHVLVAGYSLPLQQYPTQTSVETFNRSVLDRLAANPAIVAVGITNTLPTTGLAQSTYTVEGVPEASWKIKFAPFTIIYGDYFRAMQISLLDGRTFTMNDRSGSVPVVIVNEFMANNSWPGQSAIGKRVHLGNPHKGLPWATVVGVVADTKLGARDEPSGDQIYLPWLQPEILFGTSSQELRRAGGGYIALRSALPPEQMIQTLRSNVAGIDPLLALSQTGPMEELLVNVEAPRRFNTDLITAFALGALLLAVTGIYAVVAFSVSMRTQEMAIRMALGAQRGGIAQLVLIWGGRLALLGCALGVVGSIAVSRLVSSFLFEVSATDPLIYLACILIMIVMALVASAIPAMRAASVDPIEALRAE